jgi:transposase InsO family protein
VERWHQSIQGELLDPHGPFDSLEAAQAAVDAWRIEYNTARPHQSLNMTTPAAYRAGRRAWRIQDGGGGPVRDFPPNRAYLVDPVCP